MIGAIAGDIIGSVYEASPTKVKHFPLFQNQSRFTDDTVLTIAIADAILQKKEYAIKIKQWGQQFPDVGYGASFINWLKSDSFKPYNSWGNGSAMRVSPIGFAFNSKEKILLEAKRTAMVTHDHPEGIKGAQAVAIAIYLARSGAAKETIKKEIESLFNYDLNQTLAQIRPNYTFEVSCQSSVPESIIAFLEANSLEDAIRNAISLGGDSDTMACIAGGIAEAYYGGVPMDIVNKVKSLLDENLWDIVDKFRKNYSSRLTET